MSYSFGVRAASATEAEAKVRDELVQVVTYQAAHKVDCDQAFNAAASLLKLLRTPKPTEDVWASLCGSVWVTDTGEVNSASVNVSVGFAAKEVANPSSSTGA